MRNGATFATGWVGQAFWLDGGDDFVNVSDSSNLNFGTTGDFTIGLWVNFRDLSGEQVLAEKWIQKYSAHYSSGWSLSKLGDNRIVLSLGNDSDGTTPASCTSPFCFDVTPPPVQTNTWYYVVALRSGDTPKIYWNGVQLPWNGAGSGFQIPNYNLSNASSLKFGHRGNPSDTPEAQGYQNFYLKGLIDEAQIYGRALSDAEILAIYNAGSAGTCKTSPPTVSAGENLTITSEQQCGTVIQGTASDPDNDSLTYGWFEGETELLSSTPVGANGEAEVNLCNIPLPMGNHTLTLKVNDGTLTAKDDMILTIENSAPHVTASGGTYQINTPIIVRGEVFDFDNDPLTYSWHKGNTEYCSGSVPAQTTPGTSVLIPDCELPFLSLGEHTLTLTVSDGTNSPVSSDAIVKIIDSTAPTLSPKPDKSILWPPNHKMVNITIISDASDNSGLPVTLTATVVSNEPQDGLGDGDIAPDWTAPVIDQQTGIITLSLRAERSGSGSGRVYTVTITATDISGNSSVANMEIIVPHDKAKSG